MYLQSSKSVVQWRGETSKGKKYTGNSCLGTLHPREIYKMNGSDKDKKGYLTR